MVGSVVSLILAGTVGDASTTGASAPVILWAVASASAGIAGALIAPTPSISDNQAQAAGESPQEPAGGE